MRRAICLGLLLACLVGCGQATPALPTPVLIPGPTAVPASTPTQSPTTATATATRAPTAAPATPTPAPVRATPVPVIVTSRPAIPTAEDRGSEPCREGQIKGNRRSVIYHRPGQQDYGRTYSDVQCFDTEQQAKDAGFRAALR